jgi:hypothetical protein
MSAATCPPVVFLADYIMNYRLSLAVGASRLPILDGLRQFLNTLLWPTSATSPSTLLCNMTLC